MIIHGPVYQMVELEISKTDISKLDIEEMLKRILPKIQELEDEYTKYQHVWIPVEERLPEANFDVLIVHQGETKMGYCEDEVWYNSYTHRRLSDVTAWQPLPLPPK